MSAIKFHKASEYKKVFNENGLARQSVLTRRVQGCRHL